MITNYMLMAESVVVSRAKTPITLDYNAIPVCSVWSICVKGNDTNDDSGEMHYLAVVDWGKFPCGTKRGFRIIQSDCAGCPDLIGYVEGRENVIAAVRDRLQALYIAGRLTDYTDPPAIRVLPF
jgi:hypothetical protein